MIAVYERNKSWLKAEKPWRYSEFLLGNYCSRLARIATWKFHTFSQDPKRSFVEFANETITLSLGCFPQFPWLAHLLSLNAAIFHPGAWSCVKGKGYGLDDGMQLGVKSAIKRAPVGWSLRQMKGLHRSLICWLNTEIPFMWQRLLKSTRGFSPVLLWSGCRPQKTCCTGIRSVSSASRKKNSYFAFLYTEIQDSSRKGAPRQRSGD